MKFSGVTILQGVEFSIFPIDFEWALQQCSATALPVIIKNRLIIVMLNIKKGCRGTLQSHRVFIYRVGKDSILYCMHVRNRFLSAWTQLCLDTLINERCLIALHWSSLHSDGAVTTCGFKGLCELQSSISLYLFLSQLLITSFQSIGCFSFDNLRWCSCIIFHYSLFWRQLRTGLLYYFKLFPVWCVHVRVTVCTAENVGERKRDVLSDLPHSRYEEGRMWLDSLFHV